MAVVRSQSRRSYFRGIPKVVVAMVSTEYLVAPARPSAAQDGVIGVEIVVNEHVKLPVPRSAQAAPSRSRSHNQRERDESNGSVILLRIESTLLL